MTSHRERVAVLLHQLAAAQIDLVEWEQPLQRRLGVPLATDGLPHATRIAASLGYYPESTESLPVAYASESPGLGVRYNIDDETKKSLGHDCFRRLVLLPLSWSGLNFHDLEPIEIRYSGMPGHTYNIWTVPLAATCTAMVRLICAETRKSFLRHQLRADLATLIVFNFCDTSYEGDYEEMIGNEVPLSESELLEIENAVARIESWEMRDGEEWIRESLIKLASGTMTENELPSKDHP
ncbi:hypothetical protein Trco_006766 [Trichoderma cornu-damae]|uniref:Uncharacterized protein n=1 Tax=Trichoderma cornu-damae TaxID=654480 RepID=A0A9P8TU19_9HYPO|nr:hypothetical protein Trco_006766 [Trichoderma cornu-damae]